MVATCSGSFGVGGQRPAGGDVAELAGPGADAAQDHDGQRLAGSSTRRCSGRTRSRTRCADQLRYARLRSKKASPFGIFMRNPVRLALEPRGRCGDRAFRLEDAQLTGLGFDDAFGQWTVSDSIYSIRAPVAGLAGLPPAVGIKEMRRR